MQNINLNHDFDTQINGMSNTFLGLETPTIDLVKNNEVDEILAGEGSETLLQYVKKLGLTGKPNLLVLSSVHHYYYDVEELKDVSTLINIKQLNHISQIKDFLNSICSVLPKRATFIGCFEENIKSLGFMLNNNSFTELSYKDTEALENGIVSRSPILNMLYNFMDSKTNNYMSRKSVSSLLKDHGFRVLNFSSLNGLTYFHAKNELAIEN